MTSFHSLLVILSILILLYSASATNAADEKLSYGRRHPYPSHIIQEKVMEFHRLFNLPSSHESKRLLHEFIDENFSHHAEVTNSVWGNHRHLYGLHEVKRLMSVWKREFHPQFYESMTVDHILAKGNAVAVRMTLTFQLNDPKKDSPPGAADGDEATTLDKEKDHSRYHARRVHVEGAVMYYFDVRGKFHRIHFSWDHHQILYQLQITKIANPQVERIFSSKKEEEDTDEPVDASHREPFENYADLILQYVAVRNNRSPKDIQHFHSNLFSKDGPIQFESSSFGPGRMLTSATKVKHYLTGTSFVNLPGSIHAANDLVEKDGYVVLRYTRVIAVKSDDDDEKDAKGDENDRSCILLGQGFKCMHIEGISFSKFDPQTHRVLSVFTAQDNYRILRDKGVLKDAKKDRSWIYDYLYAKEETDEL